MAAAGDPANANPPPFGFATGMGVGKSLIGEIASKAKLKGLGEHDENGTKRSSVAEQMAVKQLERKESIKQDGEATANEYSDLRKGLKSSNSVGGGSGAVVSASTSVPTSPAPRSPGKKTMTLTPTATATATPTGKSNPYGNIRASLKTSAASIPASPGFVPKSSVNTTSGATPEFMNFRSKLKSPVTTSKPKAPAPPTATK
jgi:hypothetical protein